MRWYFDFISPYSYLQSVRLTDFAAHEDVECVPLLFAGLLKHWGNIGPAELAPKREWTYQDIVFRAHQRGLPLTMPAHHPFNPLPLLRLALAAGPSIDVVQRIFRFVWAEGKLPDDTEAFAALCQELKVSAEQLANEGVKQQLRANAETAIQAGVFGVPTVQTHERLFWGDDSTDMVLACMAANSDQSIFPSDAMDKAAAVPEGQRRQARPRVTPTLSSEPRIPYLPIDLAEPAELVATVRKRRGGELLRLDRMLLYSPILTEGWNHLLGDIRTRLSVSPRLRELAMCTVAVVNSAEYEYFHHAPLLVEAGASEAQAAALRQPDKAALDSQMFDQTDRATIALSIEMTRDVHVSDATFEQCKLVLPNDKLVELIATIAAYNMVSRVLVALNVQPSKDGTGGQ